MKRDQVTCTQVLHRNINTPLEIQLSIKPCIDQAQTERFVVSRTEQHSTENACHPTDVIITNLILVTIRCVPKVANKRLLRSGPSVCPHVARLAVDGFVRNFYTGGGGLLRKSVDQSQSWLKSDIKYRTLYMKIYARFIFGGETNSP